MATKSSATKTQQQYIIGVDLGGTNIVVGAMSADGKQHYAMRSIPTSAESGAEAVADRIVGLIEDVIQATMAETKARREDFLGVGIGAPGPLDREKGIVIVAPNLGWRNFPLRDRIAEKLNLPAAVDNDPNCATVGEWWQGAAQGATNVIGMTIGTGIGGGLIIDGKLFHGSSDVAGEIGHTTIDLNGRHCKCGNYGCLEAYASGPAIATRAREVLVREETASLLPSMVDGKLDEITALTVYRAAHEGDAVASEIVRYLGVGFANLLSTGNAVGGVVAGGVTRAGDALFIPLLAEVRRRAFRPAVDAARIVPGELPGTAGVVGAVATFKMQHLGGL